MDGHVIGSDPSDDIVLSDAGVAPQAALLRLTESGWQLIIAGAEDEPAVSRAWNEPTPLGQAWITVTSSGDPWTEFVDATAPDDALGQTDHSENPVTAVNLASALKKSPLPAANEAVTAPRLWARDSGRGRRASSLVMVGTVLVGMVALLASLLLFFVGPGMIAQQDSQKVGATEVSVQVAAVLERLGLKNSLRIKTSSDGTVSVTGWVRNGAERDKLAQALSQIWPMPGMQISVESEAIATAQISLQSFRVTLHAEYQGNGELAIKGIAASARERATALDAVRAQMPGMKILGAQIQLAQDVSNKLEKAFQDAGLVDVKLEWKDDRLNVQPPTLDDVDEERLGAMVVEFNKQNWNVAQLQRADPSATASSVPFSIRSVIGGAQPFIVLADGSKLLIGGYYKKYRLEAVEDTRIIFDGVRRAVVPR